MSIVPSSKPGSWPFFQSLRGKTLGDKPLGTLATSEFEAHAAEAAQFLKLLANEHRLLVLCHLLTSGETSVTALVEAVGLSQSALSQHLAKLREDGLVSFRRQSQTLFYRVSDARAERVLAVLKDIFCPPLGLPKEALQ